MYSNVKDQVCDKFKDYFCSYKETLTYCHHKFKRIFINTNRCCILLNHISVCLFQVFYQFKEPMPRMIVIVNCYYIYIYTTI